MDILSLDDIEYRQLYKSNLISMIMRNAKNRGWSVEKKTNKTYILRKKISKLTKKEQNSEKLVDLILDARNFYL